MCPVRASTPPLLAISGKICPGRTKSSARAPTRDINSIVILRSYALTPVLASFASIVTVNAVSWLEVFLSTIRLKPSCCAICGLSATHSTPRACVIAKFTFCALLKVLANTKSPSFSRSTSSTITSILPFFRSSIACSTLTIISPLNLRYYLAVFIHDRFATV